MVIQPCQNSAVNVCPTNLLYIDKSECIGNSMERINDNFKSLKDSYCTATNKLSALKDDLIFAPPVGSIIRYWGDILLDGSNFDLTGRGKRIASGGEDLYSWALCNGNNGTPDLTDRFIISTGNFYNITYPIGNRGPIFNDTRSLAFSTVQLTIPELPIHTHGVTDPSHDHTITDPGHKHRYVDHYQSGKKVGVNSGNAWAVFLIIPIPLSPFSNDALAPGLKTDLNLKTSKEKTNITIDPATTDVTLVSAGNSIPHENRPPYMALGFIMRIE
jgi:microcystin-dependent protein